MRDVVVLYLAARDPRVPWYARLLAGAAAAYALSPIDLIPDFIPVVGYLDDILIVPAAIWIAVKLTPPDVIADLRGRAAEKLAARPPASRIAAVFVVCLWLAASGLIGWIVLTEYF